MGRGPVLVVVLLLLLGASDVLDGQQPVAPDSSPPPDVALDSVFGVGSSEWMFTAGPGLGISLFHSEPGHRYLMPSISWGRVLSRPLGPGAFRGRFEWAIEVVPLFSQFNPRTTYGLGVTPLVWRWNFVPRGKLAPFAELAGGALWTRDPIPSETTAANFTAHAAYGIRYFLGPQHAIVASYRFHHISNGNRLERNPGVNAHVLQVGFSLLRPR
ncbi:MAG TPA: acyloxyacyl hydrolase [Vicinamibacterales bacterium]|nr:acyloxyacyl hydrolase [Vicinamibacterales bacterium]